MLGFVEPLAREREGVETRGGKRQWGVTGSCGFLRLWGIQIATGLEVFLLFWGLFIVLASVFCYGAEKVIAGGRVI